MRRVILGLGLVVAACGNPAGNAKDGPHVFAAMCAQCHGPSGKPDATMVARLNVRDLTAPAFRAKVTPQLVEKQVRRGSDNKLMPSFEGAIPDEQIRMVSGYVASEDFVK